MAHFKRLNNGHIYLYHWVEGTDYFKISTKMQVEEGNWIFFPGQLAEHYNPTRLVSISQLPFLAYLTVKVSDNQALYRHCITEYIII